MSLSDFWFPKRRIKSAYLFRSRCQLAMLIVFWTRENPEDRPLQSQLSRPPLTSQKFLKISRVGQICSTSVFQSQDPQTTFHPHKTNTCYKMELPFSICNLMIFLPVQGWPIVIERNRFCYVQPC